MKIGVAAQLPTEAQMRAQQLFDNIGWAVCSPEMDAQQYIVDLAWQQSRPETAAMWDGPLYHNIRRAIMFTQLLPLGTEGSGFVYLMSGSSGVHIEYRAPADCIISNVDIAFNQQSGSCLVTKDGNRKSVMFYFKQNCHIEDLSILRVLESEILNRPQGFYTPNAALYGPRSKEYFPWSQSPELSFGTYFVGMAIIAALEPKHQEKIVSNPASKGDFFTFVYRLGSTDCFFIVEVNSKEIAISYQDDARARHLHYCSGDIWLNPFDAIDEAAKKLLELLILNT